MDYEEDIQILIYKWKLLILERELDDYNFTRRCFRGTLGEGRMGSLCSIISYICLRRTLISEYKAHSKNVKSVPQM